MVSLLSALVLILSLCAFNAIAENKFTLSLTADNYVAAGSTANVTIKVGSLPKDVYAFECELIYDTQMVSAAKTSGFDDLITVNTCKWEQHVTHNTAGRYYLALCTSNDNGVETPISNTNQLEIKIPFKVKADGECTFKIVGLTAFDKDLCEIPCGDTTATVTTLARPCSFATSITCATAAKGVVSNVEVTLTNISQTAEIAALEFRLLYSSATAKAVITSNSSSQMDGFITTAPQGWQQMCSHDAAGRYTIRLLAPSGGADVKDCLQLGESIKLTIPFAIIGETASTADFDIPEAFCSGFDRDFSSLSGTGSSCSKAVTDESKIKSKDESVICDGGYAIGIPAGTGVGFVSLYLSGNIKVYNGDKPAANASPLATGMTVKLLSGDKVIDTVTLVIRGDVDCNGSIGITDAVRIRRIYLGLETADELTTLAACITGGTRVTALDYLAVKRFVQGTYKIQ